MAVLPPERKSHECPLAIVAQLMRFPGRKAYRFSGVEAHGTALVKQFPGSFHYNPNLAYLVAVYG
jgi:hypothetical protein